MKGAVIGIGLMLCLAALLTWFMRPSVPAAVADVASISDDSFFRSEQTEKMLQKQIPRVKFDQLRLDACIEFLRDASGANFFVQWGTTGLDRETPIDLDLHDVSGELVLKRLLDAAGGTKNSLAYTIDDGVVLAGLHPYIANNCLIRVYDIRDLVDLALRRTANLPVAMQMTRGEAVEDITKLIVDYVEPDTWKENGSPIGSIHEVNGCLVIYQTWPNQRRIARFLNDLRNPSASPAVPSTSQPSTASPSAISKDKTVQ